MHASGAPSFLRPALAGAAATFSGIGLARFAYVPLFPAMVAAGWVTAGEAGLLGAVNLAGYLAGVLGGRTLGRGVGTRTALDVGMALATLSFLGCGWNGGAAWLAACRALAGVAGGLLMALAGPAVQGAVAPERRGLAGGIVMMGVASGIVVAALAIPPVLPAGVSATWLLLAGLVAAIWLGARRAWPATPVAVPAAPVPPGALALALAYGLSAAGFVPHMVFFGELAVHGRGLPVATGAWLWLLFGLGGFAGPLAGGRVADRIGAGPALRIWIGLQAVATGLALVHGTIPLALSALLGGFSAVGMTAVALARSREIAGPAAGLVWVQATAAFAVAQAATGSALAALFARTHAHDLLFAIACALATLALLPVWPRRATLP